MDPHSWLYTENSGLLKYWRKVPIGLSFQWSNRPHPAWFLGQESNLQGQRPSG